MIRALLLCAALLLAACAGDNTRGAGVNKTCSAGTVWSEKDSTCH